MAVALWQLHPDWSALWHQRVAPARRRAARARPTYFYYAIALFGAAMTPYEVFFFSSGAVEEHWTTQGPRREPRQRVPRLPARRVPVAQPHGAAPPSCSSRAASASTSSARPRCRPSLALGKVGLALIIVGFFAATFGAALETSLSCGLHALAVLRLAVGQVRAAARGEPVPPRRARLDRDRGARRRSPRSTRSRSPSTRSCCRRPRSRSPTSRSSSWPTIPTTWATR